MDHTSRVRHSGQYDYGVYQGQARLRGEVELAVFLGNRGWLWEDRGEEDHGEEDHGEEDCGEDLPGELPTASEMDAIGVMLGSGSGQDEESRIVLVGMIRGDVADI